MDITLYRYRIKHANWSFDKIDSKLISDISEKLKEQPLYGENRSEQFGFVESITFQDRIFGVFVQKFEKKVIDYDPNTKEETKIDTIDCGEYLFIIDFISYDIYLQSKRSSDLPNKQEILNRFTSLLKHILADFTNLYFSHLEETKDEINRQRIVDIFYSESDSVIELDLDEFDIGLILEQKKERGGKRQTYFNPIEEYQEAMEEAAIRNSQHVEKAYIKAKKNESLKKDPIARALLEGSRKPIKITYIKDNVTHTEFGVNRSKLEVTINSDEIDITSQKETINSYVFGGKKVSKNKKTNDNNQISLELE